MAGASQPMMDKFSSRRQMINGQAAELARQREAAWGKAPDARQMDRIQRDITQRTRHAKPEGPVDLAGLLQEWEKRAAEDDLRTLEAFGEQIDVAAGQWHAAADTVTRLRDQIAAELAGRGLAPDAAELQLVEGYAAWVTREGQAATREVVTPGAAGPVADYLALKEADARDARVLRLARAISFEIASQTGQAPGAGEFETVRQFASFVTRRGEVTGPFDAARLAAGFRFVAGS
jgi:hypothetical protein